MQPVLEDEIRRLKARFRSDRDPSGRAFAPLADAYRRAGELDEAADLVEEGTARLPDFTPGHLVSARILRDRGDEDGARRAYRRALELDPENVHALREAASLAEEDDRTGDALELWHRLARLEPEDEPLRRRIRELKRRHFGVEAVPSAAAEGERDLDEPEAEESKEPDEMKPVESEAGAPEEVVEEAEPAEPKEPAIAAGAPGTDPGEEAEAGTEVYTRTMAELYARQGFQERAVEVYRHLVEERPDDADLRARLEELEARSGAGAAEMEEDRPGPAPAPEAPAPASPAGAPSDDEVETLAREWAAGPGATGELSTPFAWGEAGEPEPEPAARPSAGAYFRRMLEWSAGRETAEKEPREEEVVPIEALAPDPASEPPDLGGRFLGARPPEGDSETREEEP